jgi:hypothetical protein
MKTLKILYCTFVRSILDYGSEIWNPLYNKYIDRIEHIQMKFIKYLCYRAKIPYSSNKYLQLCKRFHLLPLYKRREIADIVYFLKIITSTIDSPELLSKFKFNVPTRSSGHYTPIYKPLVSSNFRQNSYVMRASESVNLLCKKTNFDIFHGGATAARRLMCDNFFL